MSKGKILLADDNKLVVEVTSAILEDAGYEVEVAWDGVETINRAYTDGPDLILLDIEMPKINGYQVCRLLKDDRLTSSIPIVMMTARDQQSDVFWGMKTGADAYITKGFGPEEFLELVGRQVDSGRERREVKGSEVDIGSLDGAGVLTRVIDLLDSKLFESTILSELGALASASEDLGEIIKRVLLLLHRVIGNPLGLVLLFEEGEMVILASREVDSAQLEAAKDDAFERASRLYPVTSLRKNVKVRVYGEENVREVEGEGLDLELSRVGVPLTVQESAIGILVLSGYKTPQFVRRAREILTMAKNQATIVIDNARLYGIARRMAITDGLTKLYNHRFFQELFEKEFKRADRYHSNFSVVMLDIDYFKRVNDTYGHLCGDEILEDLARLIRNCLRSIDSAARYGGEEFVLLLPETSGQEAVQTAERIRRVVEEHAFGAPERNLNITVSLGVATYPSPGVNERTDVIAKADDALYEAKERGRNMVCYRE